MLKLYCIFSVLLFKIEAIPDLRPKCSTPAPLGTKEQQLQFLEILNLDKIDTEPIDKRISDYSTKLMMDFYNHQAEKNKMRKKRSYLSELSKEEIIKGDVSNVILSASSYGGKLIGQRQVLSFNLRSRSVPKPQKLLGAQLKLYQNGNSSQKAYAVKLYKTIGAGDNPKLKEIGESFTTGNHKGWISIDVSFIFKTWLSDSTDTVRELLVSAKPLVKKLEKKEINPSSIGIDCFDAETLPFILAFLQTPETIHPARVPRYDIYGMLRSRKSDFFDVLKKPIQCGLEPFYVSFAELGFRDIVIAPERYLSGFCHGTCSFPLKMPTQATNHAIIQSMMQVMHPDRFPKPLCAPNIVADLSVLYRVSNNVILKTYEQMIIKDCGCQ